MDWVYIGFGMAFFLLTWGLVLLCDALGTHDPGDRA
jgi:hypothetical protein